MTIQANTCPYCGGPYTLTSTCYGRRTDTPGENACPQMAAHARLVRAAAEADVSECDEVERRAVTLPRYAVVVGNVGNVLDTADPDRARATYEEYVTDSRNDYGRAAGESVTLFCDGEPIREHVGTVDREEEP